MAESITPISSPIRRRTAAEAIALVEEWRSSGLNKNAFCEQRGVLRSALISCLSRAAPVEAYPAAPDGFIEVRPSPSRTCAGLTLEIEGGLRVTGLDVATAAGLVSALRAVRR